MRKETRPGGARDASVTPGDAAAGETRVPDGSRTEDYDYHLDASRVARYPSERRDESRLLHLPRDGSGLRHLRFRDVTTLVRPGDLFVLNDTRVFPARLVGSKPTGAPAEVLLLAPIPEEGAHAGAGDRPPGPAPGQGVDAHRWEALVRPGSKLKPGRRVVVAPRELEVVVEDSTPSGGRIVRLETSLAPREALERYGRIPLPPYVDREEEAVDRDRYQTVYARTAGSVAAPTAGLHFTEGVLEGVRRAGARVETLTLHVGLGTFRPVEAEDPAKHPMHRERYTIPEGVPEAVDETHRRGGRVWAVGTTVVRALESAAGQEGVLRAGSAETDLFIRPPYDFRVVGALVTNFHLPRSTLLMLVAAFAGYERTMDAYEEAARRAYRFYSYGDAMVVT